MSVGTDQSDVYPSTYLAIGSLVATASDDWTLLLELCDRASASRGAGREAAKIRRREFKCIKLEFTQW